MLDIRLSARECEEIEAVLTAVAGTYAAPADPAFLDRVGLWAQRLPERLRAAAVELRLAESAGVCLIRGFTVDDEAIGPTPGHWADTAAGDSTVREEFCFVLCASLFGDVFCWSSQQGGRLVNEVVPIEGHEERQINSGSAATLLWHTEDAFHPYRADYIGLICLRNPDRTETTVASMVDVPIASSVAEILFEPHFIFHPDEAHLPANRDPRSAVAPDAALTARSHARIEKMARDPERVAVLFGDPAHPYVRLDSDAIDRDATEPAARAALDAFMSDVDRQLREVVLEPGDMLFIDNYRAVHGRKPFAANFDGRDRWLKRINVTRDLRRSRDARPSPTSRVIY